MASLYWVGGTTTWNSTAGTKWATSSGGASGASAPTAADDVFFDASSGVVTVTSATGAVARSINFTGFTGTFAHAASNSITIGDATAGASNVALKLVSGMTYTIGNASSTFVFASTSATQQTIDYSGKTVGNQTFSGAGGSWLLLSVLTATGGLISHTAGTLDLDGHTVVASGISSTGTTTRTLTLGAASITVVGGAPWTLSGSGLTFSATGSSITSNAGSVTFAGGGYTYNNVTINVSTGGVAVTGANTYANLTLAGQASKTATCTFPNATTQTISGTFTVTGNSAINRPLIQSSTLGSQATFSVGTTVTATQVDFMDIAATGAASWNLSAITGGSGDCGGNSGITFTTSATQTATGTASFTWSTHGWTSRVPLPQDDVVVSNAFSASQTITIDMPRVGRSLNFSGCTGSPSLANTVSITNFGSFTLGSSMAWSGTSNSVTFGGRGSYVVTSAGVTWGNRALTWAGVGGTYTLQDDLSLTLSGATSTWTLLAGTLDANGHNVTCAYFNSSTTTNTRVLTLGAGTWTLLIPSSTAAWNVVATNLTINATGSTIVISNAGTSQKTFTGGGFTYGTLTYTAAGSTGALRINDSNTFDTINFSDTSNARTLTFQSGTTTTITNSFNVNGTLGVLMSITASTSGSAATLSKASGVVSCNYLSIKDSTASGGASWYAGITSTNVSGNSGWIFTVPPIVTTKTQGAIARIAINTSKNQGASARIAIIVSKTQGALARIANSLAKNQGALARVAVNLSKNQSAAARIALNLTKSQGALARIANTLTKTQGATSRIAVKLTKAQGSTSRIAVTVTKNQGATARITLGGGLSTKLQGALARIAVRLTKNQGALARIAIKLTRQQGAIARIAINTSKNQGAHARVAQTLSSAQGATARIITALRRTAMQGATARIAVNVFSPPTVEANSPTYKHRDPLYPAVKAAQRLFRFYKAREVGQTLLIFPDGSFKLGRELSQDEHALASKVYLGGHKYVVTSDEQAQLLSLGFTLSVDAG